MTDPTTLPELHLSREQEARARRVYAVSRWAAAVAITELRDGYDAAMVVVEAGPAQFEVDDEDWGSINASAQIAINYVEGAQA